MAVDIAPRCQPWCVQEHDELSPVEDGCCGEPQKFMGWSREVGDGNADASITQLTNEQSPRVYVSIILDVELAPGDITIMADELEQFAASLRAYSKEHADA
jgi:hypothetical protein